LKKQAKIEQRTNFDFVRYAQVWEDADLLIRALELKPSDVVLSIASAGDNAFSLLAEGVQKVYAVDLSFPQIACCELRKAMYLELNHQEHLLFGGLIKGEMNRIAVFNKLDLKDEIRNFWKGHLNIIDKGFMTQGKFERYFEIFRKKLLPYVHNKKRIEELLTEKTEAERLRYYDETWNNLRFKLIFKFFFSRSVMGHLGRDKEFFKYVEGNVADRIHNRVSHAMTKLNPSQNPYLHFILKGQYGNVLPYALRLENYNQIKENLDKIEFFHCSIEDFITNCTDKIDGFNLSDIFEYMTQEEMDKLYEKLVKNTNVGSRIAYWNMLVPRNSSHLSDRLGIETSSEKNKEFLEQDKAFFYSKFYLDVVKQ